MISMISITFVILVAAIAIGTCFCLACYLIVQCIDKHKDY